MPGILLHFYFCSESFEESFKSAQTKIDSALKDHNDDPTPTRKLSLLSSVCLELPKVSQRFGGITKVGTIRSVLWKTLIETNPHLKNIKGIDLYFNDEMLDRDSTAIIDIPKLWHNSVLVCKPTKNICDFIECFFDSPVVFNDGDSLNALSSSVLHEVLEQNSLLVWDTFIAIALQHWSELSTWENAANFIQILLRFDPNAARSFRGWSLLNVAIGTKYSRRLIKMFLMDPLYINDDSLLFTNDDEHTSPLSNCILEDDLDALDFIFEYGIDLNRMIDHTHTVREFINHFGTETVKYLMNDYKNRLLNKRNIVNNHSIFQTDQLNVPLDITNLIADFAFGSQVKSRKFNKRLNLKLNQLRISHTIDENMIESDETKSDGQIDEINDQLTDVQMPKRQISTQMASASEKQGDAVEGDDDKENMEIDEEELSNERYLNSIQRFKYKNQLVENIHNANFLESYHEANTPVSVRSYGSNMGSASARAPFKKFSDASDWTTSDDDTLVFPTKMESSVNDLFEVSENKALAAVATNNGM